MIAVYPIAGAPRSICAGYGMRGTKLHDACDCCAPTGTPVVAVDDGVVTWASDPTGGNVAVLRVADGTGYYYAHMLDVQSGQRKVKVGEQIGLVDTSGNAKLVGIPHVHFQVWPGGNFQPGTVHPDPTAALMAARVLSAPSGKGGVPAWELVAAATAAAALAVVAWYVVTERRS